MIHLPIAALSEVIAGIVMTLFTICALLLTLVILMQEGKGGGLAGAFGGAGADAFGVKSGTVNKFTAWLGGAFLGLALLHSGLQQATADPSIEDDGKPDVSGFGAEPGPGSGDNPLEDSDGAGPDDKPLEGGSDDGDADGDSDADGDDEKPPMPPPEEDDGDDG